MRWGFISKACLFFFIAGTGWCQTQLTPAQISLLKYPGCMDYADNLQIAETQVKSELSRLMGRMAEMSAENQENTALFSQFRRVAIDLSVQAETYRKLRTTFVEGFKKNQPWVDYEKQNISVTDVDVKNIFEEVKKEKLEKLAHQGKELEEVSAVSVSLNLKRSVRRSLLQSSGLKGRLTLAVLGKDGQNIKPVLSEIAASFERVAGKDGLYKVVGSTGQKIATSMTTSVERKAIQAAEKMGTRALEGGTLKLAGESLMAGLAEGGTLAVLSLMTKPFEEWRYTDEHYFVEALDKNPMRLLFPSLAPNGGVRNYCVTHTLRKESVGRAKKAMVDAMEAGFGSRLALAELDVKAKQPGYETQLIQQFVNLNHPKCDADSQLNQHFIPHWSKP